EDGRLHAWELLSLDLGATEMVILASGVPSPFPRQEHLLINPTSMYSLANTMSGADPQLTVDLLLEETSGQAAWLFPQAFLAAGAGRVLQPVWDVNLSALESLLQIMCDQHQAGVPWGQALRQAQRELIADGTFNDVWFWAPYQLIGRWR
ncbi:MAG: CHAT domain-containing protein, partial [Candidatus Bipolaricaulia bacterium]